MGRAPSELSSGSELWFGIFSLGFCCLWSYFWFFSAIILPLIKNHGMYIPGNYIFLGFLVIFQNFPVLDEKIL